MMIPLLFALSAPAQAGSNALALRVDPVAVPAVSQVPLDTLLWVNLDHSLGPAGAVAEILGDDLSQCAELRSQDGFRPANAKALWDNDLLRYAVVEVTSQAIYVAGNKVVSLEGGDTPDRIKEGIVLRPVLDALLTQREAQFQFRVACKDPAWTAGGPVTAASNERLLVAVAPDVPFDVVHEVLVSARKARFKHFYLHAKARRVLPDPKAEPPELGDTSMRVFVASDGGLGIDSQEEGQDKPGDLLDYLPGPAGTRSSRVVPYPASPFAAVVGAAGALLSRGWQPAIGVRLDGDELRSGRVAPSAPEVRRSYSASRGVQAVPVTLPEGGEAIVASRRTAARTRFSITGSTPHVATFTPPVHLADALNTPEVGGQLKTVLTCYRDEESDTEGLKGDLVLELKASPSGQISKVRLMPTSTIDDPHLRRCVVDAFAELSMPGAAITAEPMLWTVSFDPGQPKK